MPKTLAALILAGLAICLTVRAVQEQQPPKTIDDASALDGEEPPASPLLSGLMGSKHDFSDGGRLGRDLCLPCHTPHPTDTRPPLLDTRPAATQPVRPYQAKGIELDSGSLVCLSCHDGVIAPDVYGSGHATRAAHQIGRSNARSADSHAADSVGVRSHPIGIEYPAADPQYNPPQAVSADGKIKLPAGRVQCTSCHDPHNTAGHPGMLVKSNQRSGLCLACHRL